LEKNYECIIFSNILDNEKEPDLVLFKFLQLPSYNWKTFIAVTKNFLEE